MKNSIAKASAMELSKQAGTWSPEKPSKKQPKPPKVKGKPGRPIGAFKHPLTEKDLQKISALYGYGLTLVEIADVFGISEATFHRYMDEIPGVRESLKLGKANAKASISQTAYKLAVEGKTPEMTKFWLRCKAGWKETQVVEHAGTIDINTYAESMAVDERETRIKALAEKLGYHANAPVECCTPLATNDKESLE